MFDFLPFITTAAITGDSYCYDVALNNISSALDYGIMQDRIQTYNMNSSDSFSFNPYMSLFLM